jgi:hypothetical protein
MTERVSGAGHLFPPHRKCVAAGEQTAFGGAELEGISHEEVGRLFARLGPQAQDIIALLGCKHGRQNVLAFADSVGAQAATRSGPDECPVEASLAGYGITALDDLTVGPHFPSNGREDDVPGWRHPADPGAQFSKSKGYTPLISVCSERGERNIGTPSNPKYQAVSIELVRRSDRSLALVVHPVCDAEQNYQHRKEMAGEATIARPPGYSLTNQVSMETLRHIRERLMGGHRGSKLRNLGSTAENDRCHRLAQEVDQLIYRREK